MWFIHGRGFSCRQCGCLTGSSTCSVWWGQREPGGPHDDMMLLLATPATKWGLAVQSSQISLRVSPRQGVKEDPQDLVLAGQHTGAPGGDQASPGSEEPCLV